MTKCSTCQKDYDETEEDEVTYHTVGVDCGQSCRCRGKPRCKMCHGSFCMCWEH